MRADLNDRDLFLESNKSFHDIIAWSSGNVLFGYLIDSLLGILDGTVIGIDYPSHRRTAILKAHEEIYAALAKPRRRRRPRIGCASTSRPTPGTPRRSSPRCSTRRSPGTGLLG